MAEILETKDEVTVRAARGISRRTAIKGAVAAGAAIYALPLVDTIAVHASGSIPTNTLCTNPCFCPCANGAPCGTDNSGFNCFCFPIIDFHGNPSAGVCLSDFPCPGSSNCNTSADCPPGSFCTTSTCCSGLNVCSHLCSNPNPHGTVRYNTLPAGTKWASGKVS